MARSGDSTPHRQDSPASHGSHGSHESLEGSLSRLLAALEKDPTIRGLVATTEYDDENLVIQAVE
ncbi:MAG: hypothetical protein LKF35_01910, partial [Bifidobacterium minimum]|nr:hypothetical protein [Bifidobacterium minimum]